ncbi:hypothetical protein C5167_014773 [Papaver somniferum]|uniref:Uncharacterized protein n=1 Tax=Papaver somniferum TaxID=3469 RepID=A0A4Y7J833_PAPSO|nr:hypothetical protein C5167_014773 [Papaver somniferum]
MNKIDSKPQIGFPSSPLNRGRMKKELGSSRNVFDLISPWASVTNDVQGGAIIVYFSKRLIYFSILLRRRPDVAVSTDGGPRSVRIERPRLILLRKSKEIMNVRQMIQVL